jgi:two-component system response regulator FixJ
MTTQPTTGTVYVVDDDPQLRAALEVALRYAGLRVRSCASGEEFLQVCQPGARGCAVIDMRLPGLSGLSLQQEMMERDITLPVLFLTGYGDVESAVQAVKKGALDYLEKPVSNDILLKRIKEALQRDSAQNAASQVAFNMRARVAELTPRERQTIRLVAAGYTNKEIARHLSISYRTVEKYRAGAMLKLEISSPVELGEIARVIEDYSAEADSGSP